MVKMRLVRMGDKKSPVYRIVVVDARKAATGEYIDKIGYYDPKSQPVTLTVDAQKAQDWLCEGRAAHRNGEVAACESRRDRKERKALAFQDQGQEKEVIRDRETFARKKGERYAGFNQVYRRAVRRG